MIQHNLGVAYRERIKGDKAENLEQAITNYEKVLSVFTREAFPQDWALTQHNLGVAYFERIKGDKAENVEQAITSHEKAVSVFTREAFPQDWANTQMNLGIAYRERIQGDKAKNIEQAINACENSSSKLNPINDSSSITIPLTVENHQLAKQFAGEQNSLAKGKRVYLNTLAVAALHTYLKWVDLPSDLDSSYSWHPLQRSIFDFADLYIPELGRIDCVVALPGEREAASPLASEDTIAQV